MRNISLIILIILLLITIIGCFLIFKKQKAQVCFKNNCFKVQIADNFAAREIGLMFKKNLSKNEGMLFIFPKEGTYPFWMKNTLIPLDIIWINRNQEIVFVSENNQPCRENECPLISSSIPAKYVLEINAGVAKELELSVGDKMEIR